MTFGVLGELNWLAVLVATVVYFAIGGLWFAEFLFGKAWQAANGWAGSDGPSPGPWLYIGPAVTCLVETVALAMLANATGTDTLAEGLVLGLVVGAGVAAAALFVTGYFDPQKPKPVVWWAITAGYHVVGLVVGAIILALWT